MSYISKYFLLGITSALFVTTSTKNIYAMKRSSEEHPFAIRAKRQCNQGLSSELVDIFAAQAKVISHDDLQCDQQKRLKELQQKIQYVKKLVGEESFAEDVLITSNYFIYKIKAYCFFDNLEPIRKLFPYEKAQQMHLTEEKQQKLPLFLSSRFSSCENY